MEYIVTKRCKQKVLCGEVNLPYGKVCRVYENLILDGDKPLCLTTSDVAHKYLSNNYDGNGKRRGELVNAIVKLTNTDFIKDENKQTARWDKIWNDAICLKYKRPEHDDVWLWNHEFYNAEIADLEYIHNLIEKV